MARLNVTDLNDYCRRCDSCGSDDLVLYPPTNFVNAWHLRCNNCGEESEYCPSIWDVIDDWNENHVFLSSEKLCVCASQSCAPLQRLVLW